jgi:hypothetical protein
MSCKSIVVVICFLFLGLCGYAQEFIKIKGEVLNIEENETLPGTLVSSNDGKYQTSSNNDGVFEISIPNNFEKISLYFSHIGFEKKTIELEKSNFSNFLKVEMYLKTTQLQGVSIEDKEARRLGIVRLNPKLVSTMPSMQGIESMLKTLPGVSSNNEMSSQYNVRGGNFDENLIYVNDIEIYRPFLVRAGQQEGLSFINPDMVSGIQFSAGGFEAKYGDKMASVLDVSYRTPRTYEASVTATFLGNSVHFGGSSKDARLNYIAGFRQRTNRYILKTLDTRGDYRPLFLDGQAFVNYDINDKWKISFLGNYARNKYYFEPQSRSTRFGTIQIVKELNVNFQGNENNDFETYLAAFQTSYKPNENSQFKFTSSMFRTFETEKISVIGRYLIYDVETDFSKENFGDTTNLTGIGESQNNSRNILIATVVNSELRYTYKKLKSAIKIQNEIIDDKLSEWTLIDSAGFTLPYNPSEITLQDVVKQRNYLNTLKIMGFLQHDWKFGTKNLFFLTAGIRGNYWNFTNQLLVSPRAQFSIIPNWKRDIVFKLNVGIYNQHAFYRELRNYDGSINTNSRAQQSLHIVAGSDWNFLIRKKRMKFTGELYYKYFSNLIPYKIDNVRLRYLANESSVGDAKGIDLKLNGEIVPGTESWVSASVMQARENIRNDVYFKYYDTANVQQLLPNKYTRRIDTLNAGFIPRPSDQRVNFALYMQDYIPRFPSFKVFITLNYGTGLPYGPNNKQRYADTLRIPSYRRVDIGFTKVFIDENSSEKVKKKFKYIKNMFVSLEVFNLLAIQNTISYTWVKDYSNFQFPVPNYLTNRLLNLKLYIRI